MYRYYLVQFSMFKSCFVYESKLAEAELETEETFNKEFFEAVALRDELEKAAAINKAKLGDDRVWDINNPKLGDECIFSNKEF